jgi:hypothetical protein
MVTRDIGLKEGRIRISKLLVSVISKILNSIVCMKEIIGNHKYSLLKFSKKLKIAFIKIPRWGENMNRGTIWTITLVIILDYIQM